jgi:PAS domain S-box-containing protein
MDMEPGNIVLSVVNHIPAIVAYYDSEQRCIFSNDAYREWLGKTPEQMKGMHMKDVLGPIYELNLPHALAALRGEKQVFERRSLLPDGRYRHGIATYTPDIVDGVVRGFSVHVADVTVLRDREAALEQAMRDRDAALAEARTLRGLLPICAFCKDIRDESGTWQQMESYVSKRSGAQFSHGLCPACAKKHYGDLLPP